MNKLFFVHTPKTGGRHLTTTILSYLNQTLRNLNFDPRTSIEYIHSGWPLLLENDKVVLTYRYPPRHSVSHFFYFRPWLVDNNPENGKSIFLTAMNSLEGDRISNFQTKFICSTSVPDTSLLQSDIEYDINLLQERLQYVLVAVDGDELSQEKISEVYKNSCYFLKINPEAVMIPVISVPEFALKYSADVYSLLNEEEIFFLEEKNSLDMNLFNVLNSFSS